MKMSDEFKNWNGAMDEKMDSHHKNSIWALVKLLKWKKAIGCKRVFAKEVDLFDKEFDTKLGW